MILSIRSLVIGACIAIGPIAQAQLTPTQCSDLKKPAHEKFTKAYEQAAVVRGRLAYASWLALKKMSDADRALASAFANGKKSVILESEPYLRLATGTYETEVSPGVFATASSGLYVDQKRHSLVLGFNYVPQDKHRYGPIYDTYFWPKLIVLIQGEEKADNQSLNLAMNTLQNAELLKNLGLCKAAYHRSEDEVFSRDAYSMDADECIAHFGRMLNERDYLLEHERVPSTCL